MNIPSEAVEAAPDLIERLRTTTEKMTNRCSAPMDLWCEHSATVLAAVDALEALTQARAADAAEIERLKAEQSRLAGEWFKASHQLKASLATERAARERLEEALTRISELTPARANARDARDLHLTVKAIADSALSFEQDRATLGDRK